MAQVFNDVRIGTQICVSNTRGCKWLPQSQTVGGVSYVLVSKWDSKFLSWVTGRSMANPAKAKEIGIFIQGIVDKREVAMQCAVLDALVVGEPVQKRAKTRVRSSDLSLAPPSVNVAVDPIIDDGFTVNPGTMRVLTNKSRRKKWELWIELTQINLAYIRFGIRGMIPDDQDGSNNDDENSEDENDDDDDGNDE
jgi:hypothetical protein